jgi:hypothetical protein
MEKDSTELDNLKRKLFNKNSQSEDDQITEMRAVMREVGGYEQLMNLPLTAYVVIAQSIARDQKREKAQYDKMKARSKH